MCGAEESFGPVRPEDRRAGTAAGALEEDDGRAVSATLNDVTAWLAEWLTSEAGFVHRVTSNVPPTPPNFVRIVELNEAGEFPAGDPTDLEAGANRCAVR